MVEHIQGLVQYVCVCVAVLLATVLVLCVQSEMIYIFL